MVADGKKRGGSIMTYILISEVPPGWTISQRQNAHRAMKENSGLQSAPYPNLNTHSRGNAADTLNDEDTPNGAATAWIIQGEFAAEELERSFWIDILATELQVNPVAVDAKIEYTIFDDADQCRLYLSDNAGDWGE